MRQEPYASARRVFWVVDNGSSHRGHRAVDRMRQRWPWARLVHLPIHASWVNQVEIYLSIVKRKVLTPSDFADLDESNSGCPASSDTTSSAKPFEWKFTRADLAALMRASPPTARYSSA